MKHAGLHTVAEVLLAGRQKRGLLGYITSRSAERTSEAVAGYLGLPEDQLLGDTLVHEEDSLDARNAPIKALALPARTLYALGSMGLFRIRELVKARSTGYSKFLAIRVEEIGQIDRALHLYLARAAQSLLLGSVGQAAIPDHPVRQTPAIPAPDLSLPLPNIDELDWSVLEFRAMHPSILRLTGANFGLSQAGVRRIIEPAHEELRRKLVFLSLFLDHFEQKSAALRTDLGDGPLDLRTLVMHLLSEPRLPDLEADEKQVERLIVLLRSLVLQSNSWFKKQMEPRWPLFILLSCLVEPAIAKHEQVRRILQDRERKRKRKDIPYRELACSILAQAGKPMHFFAIAEGARQLGGRKSFSTNALHAVLIDHKEQFLRVGQGMYALAEWGDQTAEFYPAIIASVLRQANRPMPKDWIHARVSAIRPVTFSSLVMNLDLNVRFYKSRQNTYGLRGWLPVGVTQIQPIPDWLIETPLSLKRVARARAKGWDVEKIIAEDSQPQVPGEALLQPSEASARG
jgi:hypothetical protein